MSDKNILKFERPKPKPEEKSRDNAAPPVRRKGLVWLAVVLAIGLVWAYFQFVTPASL